MGRRFLILPLLVALAACKTQTTESPTVSSRQAVPAAMQGVEAKQLFGAKPDSSAQSPAAFGSYSKGCVAGGEQLAETGPTWQAMRLSRNRNWGHPEVIDYIKTLSAKAAQQPGWEGLYVGDISQPRGGPMLSGHRSQHAGHEVRLDSPAP